MKRTIRMRRDLCVRQASAPADPLQPADVSLKAAERELKRQLPAVRAAVQRLGEAKAVSQTTLSFKFSI